MVTFETATGSVYEVDDAESKMRRLFEDPKVRHTSNVPEGWREFTFRTPIEVGKGVCFVWAWGQGSADEECSIRSTSTSPVVKVAP